MKVQLTSYGTSVIEETEKPLEITSFVLGSSFGYQITSAMTNIQGTEVYRNNISSRQVVNANVYRYSVLLDANVGTFSFGEIAFLDSTGKCVALAVSEKATEKVKISITGNGNSLRVDAYFSMVDGSYTAWTDSIGSDIKFQIPVIKSIDQIPSTSDSDPNCYIVSPQTQGSSAVICYNSGSTGLWNFDCYSFNTQTAFRITSVPSSGSIVVDVSDFTTEERQDFIPQYLGHTLIEFSTGKCFSICRMMKAAVIVGNKMTISFKTPLAILPNVGDYVLFFSRSQLSSQDGSVDTSVLSALKARIAVLEQKLARVNEDGSEIIGPINIV